jgi:hypothetical protein
MSKSKVTTCKYLQRHNITVPYLSPCKPGYVNLTCVLNLPHEYHHISIIRYLHKTNFIMEPLVTIEGYEALQSQQKSRDLLNDYYRTQGFPFL